MIDGADGNSVEFSRHSLEGSGQQELLTCSATGKSCQPTKQAESDLAVFRELWILERVSTRKDFAAVRNADYSSAGIGSFDRDKTLTTNTMWRKVLKLSASPRVLLRSVLALDDSPHAIALGVAIGIFFGLTPTVGVQTALILGVLFLSRRFFYFNASAAMAATYVSNPFTMLPMYYFWYRLGTWFVPGSMTIEELGAALQFDGPGNWWSSMCALGVEVGAPMFIGALLTAPFGVALAYPITFFLVKWARRPSATQPVHSEEPSDDRVDDAHPSSMKQDGGSSVRVTATASRRMQNL